MAEYILKTHGLSKIYGKKPAVSAVDMEIERGSIYGFIGKNGAGKTTLMRIVCGLASPTEGSVELFGKTNDLTEVRAKVGSMIEMPSLYKNLTAVQNLEVQRRVMGIEDKGCIQRALEAVDLTDTGKKKAKQFSLGMKQRLGLAIALLGDPEFLILDEPINGMDPVGITEVREALLSLARDKGITILISSHILTELHHVATHYGIIHDGKLIKQVSAAELDAECQHYTRLVTNNAEKTKEILHNLGLTNYKALDGSEFHISGEVKPEELTAALLGAGVGISAISDVMQDLESYFIELIGGTEAARIGGDK